MSIYINHIKAFAYAICKLKNYLKPLLYRLGTLSYFCMYINIDEVIK